MDFFGQKSKFFQIFFMIRFDQKQVLGRYFEGFSKEIRPNSLFGASNLLKRGSGGTRTQKMVIFGKKSKNFQNFFMISFDQNWVLGWYFEGFLVEIRSISIILGFR